MNFNDIDTSGVKPSSFGQVRDLINGDREGNFSVDAKRPFTTSGSQWGYLGNITLRLQGNLSLDSSSYSFKGSLKSFDDVYDFNKSTHRGVLGEILTRAGAAQDGVPYDIEIRGSKPIYETGSR